MAQLHTLTLRKVFQSTATDLSSITRESKHSVSRLMEEDIIPEVCIDIPTSSFIDFDICELLSSNPDSESLSRVPRWLTASDSRLRCNSWCPLVAGAGGAGSVFCCVSVRRRALRSIDSDVVIPWRYLRSCSSGLFKTRHRLVIRWEDQYEECYQTYRENIEDTQLTWLIHRKIFLSNISGTVAFHGELN